MELQQWVRKVRCIVSMSKNLTAIDKVRRVEQIENSILKKTKYIWLKSVSNLTEKQSQTLYSLRS